MLACLPALLLAQPQRVLLPVNSSAAQPSRFEDDDDEPPPSSLSIWANSSTWPTEAEQCTSNGCYPRIFIIGAQKAATSSLFQSLQYHGTACGAVFPENSPSFSPDLPSSEKEAHVFDVQGQSWADLMKEPSLFTRIYQPQDCPTRHFVDATPRYSRFPAAPAHMALLLPSHWLPQLRILMLIRDPIARDLSWFNHKIDLVTGRKQEMQGNNVFCAAPNSQGIPTYHAEVECRKQELDNCMSQAREHLAKVNVAFNPDHNATVDPARNEEYPADATRLAEYVYDACAGDYRVWKDCLGKTGSDLVDCLDKTGSDLDQYVTALYVTEAPLLAWGMYLPQIRSFVRRARVARNQLLVLPFERLLRTPNEELRSVTEFMGLPPLRNNTLMEVGTHDSAYRVEVISCETRSTLDGVYAEWNAMLYRGLTDDRRMGLTPLQEKHFGGFPQIPCVDKERAVGPNGTRLTAQGTVYL